MQNYINSSTATDTLIYNVSFDGNGLSWGINKNGKGISPILYFKYVKSKFNLLERVKLDKKIKEIESAFYTAVENGQNALAEKFMAQIHIAAREALISTKGITKWIDKETLNKHKRNLREGHISDTPFKDYTRVIPKSVIKKKKQVEEIFDDFIIYHYYNENQKDLKNMSHDEKAKMKDPVLFGIFNGCNRLYLIDEWDDEYCDLSFDELAGAVNKEAKGKITKPKF